MRGVGLVLGTFLPFHKGHEFLIGFASAYMQDSGCVIVVVSSRNREPISGLLRLKAIQKTFRDSNVFVYLHEDDNAPQNPKHENDVEFWAYWKKVCEDALRYHNCKKITHVFSSELYGEKVASLINATHVMVDHARESIDISATKIRNNPIQYMNYINDNMISLVRKKFVFFGAESVGKSTTTKFMQKIYKGSICLPEYARPYLESQVDKTPSIKNMINIFNGQHAMEESLENCIGGSVISFLDTDIMSTFGYAKMIGMDSSPFNKFLPKDDRIYFILGQDEVPFEKDEIRYGGDHRESKDEFWMNLLREYGKEYYHILGNKQQRYEQIVSIVNETVDNIFKFERE